jgi:hypothetical protein
MSMLVRGLGERGGALLRCSRSRDAFAGCHSGTSAKCDLLATCCLASVGIQVSPVTRGLHQCNSAKSHVSGSAEKLLELWVNAGLWLGWVCMSLVNSKFQWDPCSLDFAKRVFLMHCVRGGGVYLLLRKGSGVA